MARHLWRLLVVVLCIVASACTSTPDGPSSPTPGASASSPLGRTSVDLRLAVVDPGALNLDALDGSRPTDVILADLLFDGLTEVDHRTGELSGSLASSWESDDLVNWQFHLDPQRRFGDDRAVTAADVKVALERAAARSSSSLPGRQLRVIDGYDEVAAGLRDDLDGVSALDDATIEIRTVEAFAELPALLAHPFLGVDSPVVAEPDGASVVTSAEVTATLSGNDRVVIQPDSGSALPLDSIDVHLYPDLTLAHDALGWDDVDWAVVPPQRIGRTAQVHSPIGAAAFLVLDQRTAVLENRDLRLAAAQAIDRDALLELLPYRPPEAAHVLFHDRLVGYDAPDCGVLCLHDPTAAAKVVEDLYAEDAPPTLVIGHRDVPEERALAEAVAADLELVGLSVTLKAAGEEDFGELVTAGGIGIYRLGWLAPYSSPAAYLDPLFRSDLADLFSTGADVSESISAALAESSLDARNEAYQSIERSVLEAAVLVPLAEGELVWQASPQLAGVSVRPDGSLDLRRVTLNASG